MGAVLQSRSLGHLYHLAAASRPETPAWAELQDIDSIGFDREFGTPFPATDPAPSSGDELVRAPLLPPENRREGHHVAESLPVTY